MRAAVMHGRGDIRFEEVPEPEPGAGELLISVSTVGVCGTDASEYGRGPGMFPIEVRHPVTGHLGPMIPGHEFAGTVVAIGSDVTGFSVGDLVVSGAGVSCGSCRQCRLGNTNLCTAYSTVGLNRHGALAEFVAAPASSCLNLAGRSISPDVAALGQPMAIAVHAMRRGGLTPGDRALIIGAGGIGAFITHAASAEGDVDLLVADLDLDRLSVAEAMGATTTHRVAPDTSLEDQLEAGFDVVYECTGRPPVLQSALALVRPGGRVVAVGIPKGEVSIDANQLVLLEKELVGTLAHAFAADMPPAMDLLERSPGLWSRIAPEVLPLEALVAEGLQPMVEGTQGRIKTLLSPSLDSTRPIELAQV
jgi:(R,R)-butanediol dehydrogenase/meso-butanediol dehydrogenase/diacetyl reductase